MIDNDMIDDVAAIVVSDETKREKKDTEEVELLYMLGDVLDMDLDDVIRNKEAPKKEEEDWYKMQVEEVKDVKEAIEQIEKTEHLYGLHDSDDIAKAIKEFLFVVKAATSGMIEKGLSDHGFKCSPNYVRVRLHRMVVYDSLDFVQRGRTYIYFLKPKSYHEEKHQVLLSES